MTATSERLAFIEEYKTWREEREIAGLPTDLDAYAEDLRAQEPLRQLAEITDLAVELGIEPSARESLDFAFTVREFLGLNKKEVQTT